MPSRRIVYDLTTLFHWKGPPSGIVRVDQGFAHWARAALPDVHFAVYDPGLQRFRKVADRWVEPLIGDHAFADTWGLGAGPAARRRYPRLAPSIAKWLTQPRRRLIAALERLRRDGRPVGLRAAAEGLQARMMSEKYRAAPIAPDGTRGAHVPFDAAFEGLISFSAHDTLISVGSGWTYLDPRTFKTLKEETRCTVVVMCHDLIPLLHPEYCLAREVEQFRTYFSEMIPHVDRVIVSTRTNEAALHAYCTGQNIRLGATRLTPLGAEIPSPVSTRPGAVEGLVPGRYALYVSTVEPRKGHRLLCRVWARLRAEGVVGGDGFKLAIVGRLGWNAEAIIAELQAEASHGTIRLLMSADDALLAALYDGAAFCVYPSMHEGYGLPIVEAFARGKAVIASDRGSIPEIAAAFAPCLDPTDENAWLSEVRRWILDPAVRSGYEDKIRAAFRPVSWEEAGRLFFRAALQADADGA